MVYQPVEAQLNNPKMNSRLFSTLLRIVRQRVFEHSRMRKSYRVLRRLRKKVFLLGKHGTLIFKKSMPFLSTNMQARKIIFFFVRMSIVLCVLAIYCYLSLIMGCVDLFQAMLGKIGFSLGSRALSVVLIRMGCSGVLTLAIGFAVRALLATEAAPVLGNMMSPTGSDSAPNEAISQPTGVMEPAAPSIDFLKRKILLVFRSISRGHRKPRTNFLADIHEDLRLETASPQKRLKIAQVLEEFSKNPERWNNNGHQAAVELKV